MSKRTAQEAKLDDQLALKLGAAIRRPTTWGRHQAACPAVVAEAMKFCKQEEPTDDERGV